MSSNSNFRNPPREKTIQDYPQLKLTAPMEGGMERKPSFMMYVHKNVNNPSNSEVRVVVYTQCIEKDPKKEKIEAKMGLVDGQTILEVLERIANNPVEEVEAVAAQTYRPKDFKNRAAGMVEDVKVVVGKNKNGVYISLVSWNNEVPRRRFFFGFDEMFSFVVREDKGQSFRFFSECRALAWSKILSKYMTDEMPRVWKPWTPNNNNNGGGNNNYQQRNNSGGSYQSNSGGYDMEGDLDEVFG